MNIKTLLLLFFGIVLFSNCTSYKNVVYLSDVKDSLPVPLSFSETNFDAKIQKNDILNIRISSLNPTDVVLLNPTSGGGTTGGTAYGYVVDRNGEIRVPLVGIVKVEGMTRYELENDLTEKLKDYTKDPVVAIRFANSKIVILGEVNRPGEVIPETERFTIFDAIGQANDLKVTAKRENILVVRDQNGKRTIGRLNLTSKEIFRSPFFYLKPKDVVYVEPIKASYVDRNQSLSRYLGLGASLISVILSVLVLIKK
jgi:polysaccharide export outer membrane protein